MLARMAGERFGAPASLVPAPAPETATSGHGMSIPASPGSAPQVAGVDVTGLPDAIAPALTALGSNEVIPLPTTVGVPGAPAPAQSPPSTPGGVPAGWGTPGEMPALDLSSIAAAAQLDPLALPVGIAASTTTGPGAASYGRPFDTTTSPAEPPPVGTAFAPHWQGAVPGRPAGSVPPSNAATPGGVGLPLSPLVSTPPSLPQAVEQAVAAAIASAGGPPPIGGAGLGEPTPRALAAPDLDVFDIDLLGVAVPLVETAPAELHAASSPSPAGTTEVAAPPTTGGPTPFGPTSLDGWTPSMFEVVQLPFVDVWPASTAITPGTTAAERPVASSGGFDPYAVRKDFPILEERVHGRRLVWLDNAATTQKPRAVIDRLTAFYEHENSNVHRAAHALAARATDAFESARETTRKFLNAPSAGDIVFVRGATEGINLIAKTWGRKHVGEGDEIVLTHLEHHANIVPWQMLCAETGARLRVAPVDDRGDVLLDRFERLINPRTKLVAFTQVSNALGTITPAREMTEIAHRHGAVVMLDGAQAVSHMPVDVQALGCDFYVFSGHKVFAPTGIGAVYGRRELLEQMPPWQGGGNMIADVTFERTVYQGPPGRFEAGTGNIADAAGLGAALDYVMRIGTNVIDRYEHDLLVYATEQLQRVPGLTLIGTSATKAGVLSFVLDGQRTEEVGGALDKYGIAVRSGHHCAQPILRRFGLEATIRASLAFYNVCDDIDALVEALFELQSHRARS